MLIALSLFFLSLFGSSSSYEKQVKEAATALKRKVEHVVEDPYRREQAVKTVEAIDRAGRQFARRFHEQVKDVSMAVSDYHSTREEFNSIFNQLEKYNGEAEDVIMTQRFILKHYVTRDEWNRVFSRGVAGR